jgi:hypothetical protein
LTDLDRDRELKPTDRRRGVILTMVIAGVAALIVVALLFSYRPWTNQTASDSANSNAGATMGQGAGGQSAPAPTMPGQAAPAPSAPSR